MKVNDLSKMLGINASTIRYYDRQGLLMCDRTDNNYRNFDILDALDLHLLSSYRSLDMSLDNAERCLKSGSEFLNSYSDAYIAECEKQIEELKKRIERVNMLTEYSRMAGPDEVNMIDNLTAMYNLWDYTKEKINDLCASADLLFEKIPYSYIALKISKEDVMNGEISHIDFGLGIIERYYKEFDLNIRGIEKREGGKAVYLVFECERPDKICINDLQPMISYLKDNNLSVKSDFLGRISSSRREDDKRIYQIGISVLI
ncbi:MAG: MerR family transcriptional regulator [Erysipelotrichaceae bacterium]